MIAPAIEIKVYGQPAPQGSKSFRGIWGGKAILTESSKAVKPWRDAVRADAIFALAQRTGDSWTPLDCPLAVEMVFTMPKPASAPKRRRTWPSRMPDLSKLARSTEDALTDAGIWRDDARVVEYRRLAKVYPGEDVDALSSPGVVIRIHAIGETAPGGDDMGIGRHHGYRDPSRTCPTTPATPSSPASKSPTARPTRSTDP
ncbi:RusA family crossover junction endodeoxyribonuclease [Rhizomonospora bruguierae]|uniref:RusA family crossover junction endodeoxyribonuclease n=1 Tax=Rhizomonospora bruguierae TaxID=1581705 RepID=UPI001BCBAAF4|nr:RusA family crossover junction endodeoxyribonuclease [Micromonospora sp. NBRC 107566]